MCASVHLVDFLAACLLDAEEHLALCCKQIDLWWVALVSRALVLAKFLTVTDGQWIRCDTRVENVNNGERTSLTRSTLALFTCLGTLGSLGPPSSAT